MKNKLKTLLALLLIAVIALSAVGCTTESGSTSGSSNNTSENEETKKEENEETKKEENKETKKEENKETKKEENLLYSDDNFKITFIDFKDPKAGATAYNLYLKIENNSDKTVIVSPSDGYANNEAVFIGSGMPVKIAPNKMATGVFVVGYGNTSIQSIDEIKTLELKITLYDENWSGKVLETENLTITLE